MKKTIIIINLFIVFSGYSQTRFIPLDTNIRWYVTSNISNKPDHYTISYFYLSTDTVINDLTYYKVILADLNNNSWYSGAIRYDSLYNIKTVPLHEKNEHILYPFNLAVGDTINIFSTIYHDVNSNIYQKLVVKSMDTIRYEGLFYKCYELRRKCVNSKSNQIWIQGLGSINGLLSNYIQNHCYLDDIAIRVSGSKPDRLVAISIYNKLIYFDPCFSKSKNKIIKHLKNTK